MKTKFGFREHAHTADWELEVWAPDLATLLEQAARGMYSISGVRLEPEIHQRRSLELKAEDAEGLLVRFLSELLWLEEQDRIAFDHFDIQLDSTFHMQADLIGADIARLDKEIKAVTYHNLNVERTPRGLQVNIVFDV
jgi:SHS2 domain-containing protein